MTALRAMAGIGRYHIQQNGWGGYIVIDSHQTRPISRLMGNFGENPLDAWAFIKKTVGAHG